MLSATVESLPTMARKPEGPKKSVSLTIDPKVLEAANSLAASDERSLSWLVEKALIAYMESKLLRDDAKPPRRPR